MFEKISKFFNKNKIGNPPWDYIWLVNLDEDEYPKYLKKLYKINMGESLDLKHPKTFTQKIQWLKLFNATAKKQWLTDKVLVRDFIADTIGDEFLKPVEQVCDAFENIDFEKLPTSFIMKCNHGCKWHYIIKNKEEYLKVPKLIEITKKQMTGWLEQEFWPWAGFEMQYKGIIPKILIEPLMRDNISKDCNEIHCYCFNGLPKIIIKLDNSFESRKLTFYDENLKVTEDLFGFVEQKINVDADDNIRLAVELSKKLSKEFSFVRVDWMTYKNTLYFAEMTFTPYSGFMRGINKEFNRKLGNLITIER